MNKNQFANQFEELYRATYARAVRTIRDKRERLSPETNALLTHLSFTGPLSLSELSQHVSRAPSTLSEMIDHLEAKGLLERETDPKDKRRTLIWLTDLGIDALINSSRVLDHKRLKKAIDGFSKKEREQFLVLFEKFIFALKEKDNE